MYWEVRKNEKGSHLHPEKFIPGGYESVSYTHLDVSNNTYYPVANLFAERDGTWNGKTVQEVFPEFDEPQVLGMSSRWESFLYSMMYLRCV